MNESQAILQRLFHNCGALQEKVLSIAEACTNQGTKKESGPFDFKVAVVNHKRPDICSSTVVNVTIQCSQVHSSILFDLDPIHC